MELRAPPSKPQLLFHQSLYSTSNLALFKHWFKALPALCLSWWNGNVSTVQSQPALIITSRGACTSLAEFAKQGFEAAPPSSQSCWWEGQASSKAAVLQQSHSSSLQPPLLDSSKDTHLCTTGLSYCPDKSALCNQVQGGNEGTLNERCRLSASERQTDSSSPVLYIDVFFYSSLHSCSSAFLMHILPEMQIAGLVQSGRHCPQNKRGSLLSSCWYREVV